MRKAVLVLVIIEEQTHLVYAGYVVVQFLSHYFNSFRILMMST